MCLPPYSASAAVRVLTNHHAHTQGNGACAKQRTRVLQIVDTTERTHTRTHAHTTGSRNESLTERERERQRETLRSVGASSAGTVPRSVGVGIKSSRNRSMSPLAPPPLSPPPAFPLRPGLLSFGAANTLRRQPATHTHSLSRSLTAHAHACTHVRKNYRWI